MTNNLTTASLLSTHPPIVISQYVFYLWDYMTHSSVFLGLFEFFSVVITFLLWVSDGWYL